MILLHRNPPGLASTAAANWQPRRFANDETIVAQSVQFTTFPLPSGCWLINAKKAVHKNQEVGPTAWVYFLAPGETAYVTLKLLLTAWLTAVAASSGFSFPPAHTHA